MNKLIKILMFVMIWFVGAAFNAFYFKIESSVWLMFYGFMVGFMAHDLTLKEQGK